MEYLSVKVDSLKSGKTIIKLKRSLSQLAPTSSRYRTFLEGLTRLSVIRYS